MLDNPLTSSIGFPSKEVFMPEGNSSAFCIKRNWEREKEVER